MYMRYIQSLVVAAATFNLAIGAPIKETESREVVATEAVRRALENNPGMQLANRMSDPDLGNILKPGGASSLLPFLRRLSRGGLSKREYSIYSYIPTPLPPAI
jgi:hypothetical protein